MVKSFQKAWLKKKIDFENWLFQSSKMFYNRISFSRLYYWKYKKWFIVVNFLLKNNQSYWKHLIKVIKF
jgi:hypothetical protein